MKERKRRHEGPMRKSWKGVREIDSEKGKREWREEEGMKDTHRWQRER